MAVAALVPKLIIAHRTFGTNDIVHWQTFVQLIREHGPIGIYKVPFTKSYYNHPPLMGWVLEAVRGGERYGWSVRFSIRAMASVADVLSAIIVFELLRVRVSLTQATVGAVAVACSPVLFIISGFHGNTDPVFTMLALLSVYLLVDRDKPALAGAAMALSLGVKIVGVVAVPCLLIYALYRGRAALRNYLITLVGVSLTFWGPALVKQRHAVTKDVLGYGGIFNHHNWGIDQIDKTIGGESVRSALEGSGRSVIVLLCAALPAILVWKRPQQAVQAFALALSSFLALTPIFGTQYLVWAAAPSVLLSVWGGTLYNLAAGALLLKVYTRWSGGFPWYRAHAGPFTHHELIASLFVWLLLLGVIVDGIRRLDLRSQTRAAAPAGSAPAVSTVRKNHA